MGEEEEEENVGEEEEEEEDSEQPQNEENGDEEEDYSFFFSFLYSQKECIRDLLPKDQEQEHLRWSHCRRQPLFARPHQKRLLSILGECDAH